MEKISTVEDGVRMILNNGEFLVKADWSYAEGAGRFTDELVLNGVRYPLFYWREDPQIAAVAANARNGVGEPCSCKISGFASKTVSLDRLLYRQADIAEWILGSIVGKLTAVICENAVTAVFEMKNGKVASLELSNCLPAGAKEQIRHTCWGTQGMISTRVVSSKQKPQAVYLYKDRPEPYTFNDNLLSAYGLSEEDTAKAVAIVNVLLRRKDPAEWREKDVRLPALVAACFRSAESMQPVNF